MTLRLIEINLPKNKQDAVEELISDRKEILDLTVHPAVGFWKIPVQGRWKIRFSTDMILIRMLVLAEGSQTCSICWKKRSLRWKASGLISSRWRHPFPTFSEEDKLEASYSYGEERTHKERVSRQELHNNLEEGTKTTNIYVFMMISLQLLQQLESRIIAWL